MEAVTPYDSDFYNHQSVGSYRSANVVVPIANQIIKPRSICDVGCGIGSWLHAWKNVGVKDVCGIDGNYVDRSLLMIDAREFIYADLRKPLTLNRTFDLVLSLEVAEHLPAERAEGFVADLSKIAPVVLFSAAVPQQGGTDHINEQWQEYWANLFRNLGFIAFDCIRPVVWDDEAVERWYRQNIILYCRNSRVSDFPALSVSNSFPLSIVHPKQYVERHKEYGVRETLTLLGASLRRASQRRMDRLMRRP